MNAKVTILCLRIQKATDKGIRQIRQIRQIRHNRVIKVVNDCSYSHRYTIVNLAGFIDKNDISEAAQRT